MKELFPVIKENLKNSYFATAAKVEIVMEYLKQREGMDKRELLIELSKRDRDDLELWNLFAVAWRTIERTVEYPFKVNDNVKINNRLRLIKSIDYTDRMAQMENGDLVGLILIKELEPKKAPEFEQMTLF